MKRRTFPRLLAAAAAVLILLGIGAYAASPFFSYQESVATLSKVGSQGDEVRKIQTRLKELGYDPGSVDGIFGEKTRKHPNLLRNIDSKPSEPVCQSGNRC